jgi:hypothetical protein
MLVCNEDDLIFCESGGFDSKEQDDFSYAF